jgi:hypothetical protein
MHSIPFTGALLIPPYEQVNGVFHNWFSGALEAQQPVFGITLSLAAGFAKEFHRAKLRFPGTLYLLEDASTVINST